MIETTKGDLLRADVEALVNTVNTVGVMGKGIALQFKKAFPENYKAYRKACDEKNVKLGRMFVFETDSLHNPRYIINFPTKRHWRGRSRLGDIEDGLQDLVRVIQERDIQSVAIPPLGCGNGGLDWVDVYPRIEQALKTVPDVHALVYEPKGAPEAAALVDRTTVPPMTQGRAAVIGLLKRYAAMGYRMTLLEVQKLLYFLQEAGEHLKLRFVKHKYGPYADNLRHVLGRMEGHFIQGFGDGTGGPSTSIELLEGADENAEEFLGAHPDTKARFDRVTQLIEGFETPYGMELLASVHWVALHEDMLARRDSQAAVPLILAWSKRKREKFRPEHIHKAWQRLNDQGWL